jgi:hypothetical protein
VRQTQGCRRTAVDHDCFLHMIIIATLIWTWP